MRPGGFELEDERDQPRLEGASIAESKEQAGGAGAVGLGPDVLSRLEQRCSA